MIKLFSFYCIFTFLSFQSFAQIKEFTLPFICKTTALSEVDCKEYLDIKGYKFYSREEAQGYAEDNNFFEGQFVSSYTKGYKDIPAINGYIINNIQINKGNRSGYCVFQFGEYVSKQLKSQLVPYKKLKSWFNGETFYIQYSYKNYLLTLVERTTPNFKNYKLAVQYQ
jgi:hypothetical protein